MFKIILKTGDTVRKHLDIMYEELHSRLIKHLELVKDINITTDHWTERYSSQSYLTISASYFHPVIKKLFNRVLGTFPVKSKTAITTIREFILKLKPFNIDHKIRMVVTDNAKNMSNAFVDYDWTACTAHDLALVQKHAFGMDKTCKKSNPLSGIKKLVDAAKDLVRIAKRDATNSKLPTRLKQKIPVRWDTNYDMFKSILDNFDSIKQIEILQIYINKINRGLLEEIVTLLEPLKNLRMQMSKNGCVTIQYVAMAYDQIMALLTTRSKDESSDSDTISLIKKRFITQMKLRYVEYQMSLDFIVRSRLKRRSQVGESERGRRSKPDIKSDQFSIPGSSTQTSPVCNPFPFYPLVPLITINTLIDTHSCFVVNPA